MLARHNATRNRIRDLCNRVGILQTWLFVRICNDASFDEHRWHRRGLEHDQIVEAVNAESPVYQRTVFALDRRCVIQGGRFACRDQFLPDRPRADEALLIVRIALGNEDRVALELATSSRIDPCLRQRVVMNRNEEVRVGLGVGSIRKCDLACVRARTCNAITISLEIARDRCTKIEVVKMFDAPAWSRRPRMRRCVPSVDDHRDRLAMHCAQREHQRGKC